MKKFSLFFYICYFLFSLMLIILTLASFSITKLIISILIILSGYLLFKYKDKIKLNKYIIISLILLPIVLRFLLLLFDYVVVSDYETFYLNAVAISSNSDINNLYYSAFPYLYPYTFVLGLFMKVLGTGYSSVIILNIIFDLIGAYFIYKLISNLTNKKTALIGLLIYLYNPFSFIYITKCAPIIVVNMGIIISFYVFSLLKSKFSLLSVLLGILLSLFNSFRPILIVFLIAISIYTILNKQNYFNLISIILVFFLSNILIMNLISNKVGYEVSNNSGWSMYLGSNYLYDGAWNIEDGTKFSELINDVNYTPISMHDYFKEEAITRYKDNGLNNIILFAKKTYNTVGRHQYYSLEELTEFSNIGYKSTFNILTLFYFISILSLNLISSYKLIKKKELKYLPYLIFGLGVLASNLFVEAHARYFTPIYPTLIIGATILFYFSEKCRKPNIDMV